ncbi:sensor domain-containing diguanylate cyclase [Paenibacillus sedimenti]|uniref:Diguanylate cyclase n=1 Tax=Paenibacillus sedimenti TaxID=2770274 RepID=A0A926KWQ0_9BACL|nr:sensor domain-containing diguanylate cyclase [Paenibacillus sedimenti]MBD0383618.1 diguanylate cyclase [Paenibacillus sedimenti]
MVQGLISNFSILAASIFVLVQCFRRSLITSRHNYKTKLVLGLVFGLVAIMMMFFGIHVAPTVFIDLRSLAILCAAMMGGYYSSVLVGLIISAGRIFLFGGFTDAAIASSISAVLTGIICGLIAYYVNDYRKKWVCSLLVAALLPSVVIYSLMGKASLYITPVFLFIFLSSGALIAYFIHYLDKLKSLFLKYEAEVSRDYLTGLLNYRAFDTVFNEKLQQADYEQAELSVLLLDIDFFKKINDTYGHKTGDEVLKQFAAVLTDSTRPSDFVFRIGGEEFAILLEKCSHSQALIMAEKLRLNTHQRTFHLPVAPSLHITASIGVATFPEVAGENLLEYADNALYGAKKGGRNKVVSYTG